MAFAIPPIIEGSGGGGDSPSLWVPKSPADIPAVAAAQIGAFNFGQIADGDTTLANLISSPLIGDLSIINASGFDVRQYPLGNGLPNDGGNLGYMANSNVQLEVLPADHSLTNEDFTMWCFVFFHSGIQTGGGTISGPFQSSSSRLVISPFGGGGNLRGVRDSNTNVTTFTNFTEYGLNLFAVGRSTARNESFFYCNGDYRTTTFWPNDLSADRLIWKSTDPDGIWIEGGFATEGFDKSVLDSLFNEGHGSYQLAVA